jgi:hypothetical protein
MKKIKRILMILILVSIVFILNCSDEIENEIEKEYLSIYLYDQPLDTIREYIKGKWIWHYSYGGITGKMYKERHKSFMQFGPYDRMRVVYENELVLDTIIYWEKRKRITSDSSYMIITYRKDGLVNFSFSPWIVCCILNDTLHLEQNAVDGSGHALTKHN